MQDALNSPGDDPLSQVVAEALKRMLAGSEPAQAPAKLLQTLRLQLARVLAEAPMVCGDVAEIELRAHLACLFEKEISRREALIEPTNKSSQHASNLEERRRWPRYQVRLRAQLLSGAGSFNCTVIDLSQGGAQIDVAEPVPISAVAVLNMEDGTTYVARRRWVNGTRAGFEFTGPPLVSARPDGPA